MTEQEEKKIVDFCLSEIPSFQKKLLTFGKGIEICNAIWEAQINKLLPKIRPKRAFKAVDDVLVTGEEKYPSIYGVPQYVGRDFLEDITHAEQHLKQFRSYLPITQSSKKGEAVRELAHAATRCLIALENVIAIYGSVIVEDEDEESE